MIFFPTHNHKNMCDSPILELSEDNCNFVSRCQYAVAMEKRSIPVGAISQTVFMYIPLLRGGERHRNCGQDIEFKHTFQTKKTKHFFPLKLFSDHEHSECFLLYAVQIQKI